MLTNYFTLSGLKGCWVIREKKSFNRFLIERDYLTTSISLVKKKLLKLFVFFNPFRFNWFEENLFLPEKKVTNPFLIISLHPFL
jgi:hypothetical protein